MNLTPDQAGKFFDLKEKFMNDTAAVRKQMMVKHAELAALQKAEKPDQAAITAKQAELKALWDQMKEKRTAFQAEAGKISPDLAKGFGRGMGRGMRHGGGMGPGGCPMVGGRSLAAPGPRWRPGSRASGQIKILPAPLINLLMVRGFLTGPSPFFVFPPPDYPASPSFRSTNLVSSDGEFLKILQLCLKLKTNNLGFQPTILRLWQSYR